MPSETSFEALYSASANGQASGTPRPPNMTTEAYIASVTATNAYEGNPLTFTLGFLPRNEDSWAFLALSGTANWDTGDFANISFAVGNTKTFVPLKAPYFAGNYGMVLLPANQTKITISVGTTVNNDGASAFEQTTLMAGLRYGPISSTATLYDLTTAAPDPYKPAQITKVTGYNGLEGKVPLIFRVDMGLQDIGVIRSASIRLAGQDGQNGMNFIEGKDLGAYANVNDPRYFSQVFEYTNGVRFDPIYKELIIPAGVKTFDVRINTVSDREFDPEFARLWVGNTWGQAKLIDQSRALSSADDLHSVAQSNSDYLSINSHPVMMA